MDPKPRIFISAVSKELKSARQLVANTLTFLGFEPVWQDVFGAQSGDLRDMLRNKIAPCQGLVQLAGQRFGFGPTDPETDPSAISYTQFELLHAREIGKKIWPILLAPDFPVDEPNNESAAGRENQQRYRHRLEKGGDLYQLAADMATVETFVLKLRQPLEELRVDWERERRRTARFRTVAGAALVVILGALGWLAYHQSKIQQQVQEQVQEQRDMNAQLLAAIRDLPQSLSSTGARSSGEDQQQRLERAFADLEARLKLPPGSLKDELPKFAEQLLQRKDVRGLDRARALMATGKFADAKSTALFSVPSGGGAVAANTARPIKPPTAGAAPSVPSVGAGSTSGPAPQAKKNEAIEAFVLAGQAAEALGQYDEAAARYRSAAALTSLEHNVLEWADVQNKIGWLLYLQGKYADAERTMEPVWKACLAAGKAEDPIALTTRNRWASTLLGTGQYAQAETELRAVLAARRRILGPEHIDTLSTWNNLAAALDYQKKYTEAEAEHRARLAIEERTLGAADVARSRMNLAVVLMLQRKFTEAEAEFRKALAAEEKTIGPGHRDTAETAYNLALTLREEGKVEEARTFARQALDGGRKALGADHPDLKRYEMLVEKL